MRENMKLSMDALWLKCGVSRDTISRVEGGSLLVSTLAVDPKFAIAETGPQWYRLRVS